jgi:uncharacterized protein (DUF1778 family)
MSKVERKPADLEVRRPRLSIEIEPQLRRRLRVAAAQRDITIREFVVNAVERALEAGEASEVNGWSAL